MSLRSKIALVLFLSVAAFVSLDNSLQRLFLRQRVGELEAAQAQRDVARAKAILDGELEELVAIARSLRSSWDFALRRPGSPLDELAVDELPVVMLCDAEGKVLWHRVRGPAGRAVVLRELPTQRLAETHPLLAADAPSETVSGLLGSELGELIVASLPVGAHRLIAGRFLRPEELAVTGRRFGVDLVSCPMERAAELVTEPGLLARITSGEGTAQAEDAESGAVHAYTVVRDVWDRPELLLRTSSPRDVATLEERTILNTTLSAIALLLLFPLVVLVLLQRIVTGPLAKLTVHAEDVGTSDDTSARLSSDRKDEIGSLARSFDQMLVKLEQSRNETVQIARRAGMSQVSAGVLHDFGNVLNSVRVASVVVGESVGRIDVRDLEAILGELEKHRGGLDAYLEQDPRGRFLLPFFADLRRDFESRKATAIKELSTLTDGLERLTELLQSVGHEQHVTLKEKTSIVERVETALKIVRQQHALAGDVQVSLDYEEVPDVYVDGHGVLEILVNLILNATQAMAGSRGRKALHLSVRREGADFVRVDVSDTGDGIEAEDLARVFNHGFTTRSGGKGIGLHVSANRATELGGRLSLESQGRGTGATATFRIPVDREPARVRRPAVA